MKITEPVKPTPSLVARPHRKRQRKSKALPLKTYHSLSKSVGAIVLNQRLCTLLIFQQKNKYWEFPKGKMEHGEKELDTLKREIFEETGIQRYALVEGFRHTMYYDLLYKGRLIRRKIIYFLIITNDRVHISKEHMRYQWLSLENAKKKLKHVNQVKLIDQVIQTIASEEGFPVQDEIVYEPSPIESLQKK